MEELQLKETRKIINEAYKCIHGQKAEKAINMILEIAKYFPQELQPYISFIYNPKNISEKPVNNFLHFLSELERPFDQNNSFETCKSQDIYYVRYQGIRTTKGKKTDNVYKIYFQLFDFIFLLGTICKYIKSQESLKNENIYKSIYEALSYRFAKIKASRKYDVSKTARNQGYLDNKDVRFKQITGIDIKKFRSLQKRHLQLGQCITVITGKNGTMKSSLLGLVAHPFSSPSGAKDLYGNELKTDMRDVFRLSLDKDKNEYIYYIQGVTQFHDEISEPIRLYARVNENRHRITVGAGNTAGEGNFLLNTSVINLSRVYPIIQTNTQVIKDDLTPEEKRKISKDYFDIMQREAFADFETVSNKHLKNTCGPKDSYYDFNSISSGEDNLGSILYKLIAFERAMDKSNYLQGLLCIDEVEASFHPVTQKRFFDFLYKWCKKYKMQVILTTHSLYLINHCLRLKKQSEEKNQDICLVNISTQQVSKNTHNFRFEVNPSYEDVYKELTYDELGKDEPSYKVNIICEDGETKKLIRKILGRNVLKAVNIISDLSGKKGNSKDVLKGIAKKGTALLGDSIIVLDADVTKKEIGDIKFKRITTLYDPDNLCLEKALVYFIGRLNGDESIFQLRERNAILATFSDYKIPYNNLDNIRETNVDKYKKWHKNNSEVYAKALDLYYRYNKSKFDECKKTLVEMINDCRERKNIDPLVIR